MAMREKTTSIVECNHDNVHMANFISSVGMLYIHIHRHALQILNTELEKGYAIAMIFHSHAYVTEGYDNIL